MNLTTSKIQIWKIAWSRSWQIADNFCEYHQQAGLIRAKGPLALSFWAICSVTGIWSTKRLMLIRDFVNNSTCFPTSLANYCQITVRSNIPPATHIVWWSIALTLALVYFVVLLLAHILVDLMKNGCRISNKAPSNISMPKLCQFTGFLPSKNWTAILPSSLTASASVTMLMEGILHMPSLPVLVMIFASQYIILLVKWLLISLSL